MNSKLLALTMAVLLVVLSLGVASPVLASEPDEMEEPELEEFRFEGGKVNKVSLMEGKGWIVVDYTKFKVTTDTDIRDEDGMLMKGVFVDLRFERHHDKLIATRITVLDEDPEEVRFEGEITKLALMHYKVVVEGTKFITNADTEIDEGLAVGDLVRVEADRMDGKLIATRITLLD